MGGVGRSTRPTNNSLTISTQNVRIESSTNQYKFYSDSAMAKADPPRRFAPPLRGGEFSGIAQIPKTPLSKEREEMESHPGYSPFLS
jgi:hypothetical protein